MTPQPPSFIRAEIPISSPFPQQPNQSISSIPSPGISNHLIITTADVRGKCYLNKEVHSNIISKNKTWKPPKYSIIEEQFRRKWLAYDLSKKKKKKFADIKNNMQKQKIFLAMLKHRTHSTFAWKIPWMEEPGRLQSMESLRVGHD